MSWLCSLKCLFYGVYIGYFWWKFTVMCCPWQHRLNQIYDNGKNEFKKKKNIYIYRYEIVADSSFALVFDALLGEIVRLDIPNRIDMKESKAMVDGGDEVLLQIDKEVKMRKYKRVDFKWFVVYFPKNSSFSLKFTPNFH